MNRKTIWLALGAVLLPFAVEAVLMLIAEPFYGRDVEWMILQSMGGTAGFAAGVLCLWGLPIRTPYRVVLALVYWPIMNGLMMYWSLIFTGYAFNRWL